MGYCDYTDAWVFALTRERRRQSADGELPPWVISRLRAPETLRFSVRSEEFTPVILCEPVPVPRRKGAARRWLQARWHAGDRRCYYCDVQLIRTTGRPRSRPTWRPGRVEATVDHKQPLVREGLDDETNWCVACWGCNNDKGAMTEAEFVALRRSAA